MRVGADQYVAARENLSGRYDASRVIATPAVVPAKAGTHFDLALVARRCRKNGFRLSPE